MDDLREGSWVQTPPSIEDRNSTVAKHKQSNSLSGVESVFDCMRKTLAEKTVQTEFQMKAPAFVEFGDSWGGAKTV